MNYKTAAIKERLSMQCSQTIFEVKSKISQDFSSKDIDLCVDHVIWTGHRMLKLVLNIKLFLLFCFSILL